ncbi:hypothetical protein COU19_00540 [Candidatus Kaiserbacteria bacterium CG10_big_fil_rev_8_21_14_0_10_56_12]|uniref:Methyltransferase FkbM domain-containing protein n=1 Tax=Candidatus Kaiserbacteria bacterium CG10_big_fil_rev_8_21_14_0_10_56_12 TaxID=1974611 RepID=A0A2H0UCD8_9BACT|nr:MAG: hypothetical protein COU19_00540 [Candidatus Kaiserbacteria bacterium CG10_big_fil_rev_8_21_14_0_10_56_12]
MRVAVYLGYLMQLQSILGWPRTCQFALAHLRNKLIPPRKGRLASVPVGPYRFYFPSLVYFTGLFAEIFLNETYYLEPTMATIRVIDCGANIGMSLLYIKIRAPHAQVQCFEPNPAARAVLEHNVRENGWQSSVEIYPYALGTRAGTVTFYVEETEATSSGGSVGAYQKNKGRALTSYPVEVQRLSPYLTSPIAYLKIDIEGPELEVLEELAAAHTLEKIASIQLEYHYIPGHFTRSVSELLRVLEEAGFRTFVKSYAPPHRIIGHDGWLTYMVFAWR